MSTIDVKLSFPGTDLPDEDILLAVIPQVGEIIWTTEAFLGQGDDDNWENAISWRVDSIHYFLHKRKTVVLLSVKPYSEKGAEGG